MTDIESWLAEQRRYYRERAPEYDKWWNRDGSYDRGPEYERLWWDEVAELDRFIAALAPLGRVLEIAAGTGNWTSRLVRHAESITAFDSSPETLAINREKVAAVPGGPDRVIHVVEDAFTFEPGGAYDTVFFGFWLTHVPDERFDDFWARVDRCLVPGGRVAFVDNAHPSLTSGAVNSPVTYAGDTAYGNEGSTELDTAIAVRRLEDGRVFRIVKRFWRAHELAHRLAELGWSMIVVETPHLFLAGHGGRTL